MPLFHYHQLDTPICKRSNAWLGALHRDVFLVWNQAIGRHQVFAKSANKGRGGSELLFTLESDQGEPMPPEAFRELITTQLQELLRSPAEQVREIEAHNDKLTRTASQAQTDAMVADAEYVSDYISKELDGASRFSGDDVLLGLEKAHGPVAVA